MRDGTLQLSPTPCNKKIKSYDFSVNYQISKNQINLSYHMSKQLYEQFKNTTIMPNHPGHLSKREDKLWEKNCLEFFFKPDSRYASYYEFNFSLEGKWNVFHFDDYWKGKKEAKKIQLEKIEFPLSSRKTAPVMLSRFTLSPELQLRDSYFHSSAILYINKEPSYFHTLPDSQRPADFHRFHEV